MEYEKRTKIIAISKNYNDNLHDFFREKLNREILRVNLLTKSNDKDIYEVTYLEEKRYFQREIPRPKGRGFLENNSDNLSCSRHQHLALAR